MLQARSAFRGVRLSAADRARLALAALRVLGLWALRPPAIPPIENRVSGRRRSLAPTMVYWCAHFASPGDTLEAAQERKLELICRKLRVTEGEHVRRDELGRYGRAIGKLLRPGGLLLNHGITRLAPHAPEPDPFISRYVFPDGELHPVTDVMSAMQATGLEIRDVESLREHYPLTLRRWLANLAASRDEAIAEVGAQRERAWRLYMLGSALGFEAAEIGVYQVLTERPGAQRSLPLDGPSCSRQGRRKGDRPSVLRAGTLSWPLTR